MHRALVRGKSMKRIMFPQRRSITAANTARPGSETTWRKSSVMPTRYMQRFFDPRSIAVVGASEREDSLGRTVLQNLIDAGFPGTLMAVNRHGDKQILGLPRYGSVADLPEAPDLAVITTSPGATPEIVGELGKKGVHAVLIVMGGLSLPAPLLPGRLGGAVEFAHNLLGVRLESGKTLKEAAWEAARPYDMRIMGPNCMGVIVPGKQLNASYAHTMVPAGNVAFVGQSAVLGLALVDWAQGRGLGLSHITTLDESLDIEIADVVEYLADDLNTRAILLHVQHLDSGQRFVSALRAAARGKLVVVMKSRRVPQSQENPESVAAGLTDGDVVYDAVLSRAGVLRVERTDEIYNALETLIHMRRLHGDRLAVICNGTGPATLATDHLIRSGGRLAALSETTIETVGKDLAPIFRGENPVNLFAIATPERFTEALEIVLADAGVDAVLLVHVPIRISPSLATAEAIIPTALAASKPVLTAWMGEESAQAARTACDDAGIPTFDTPEQAVDAFIHMNEYRRNQEQLAQLPPSPGSAETQCDLPVAWSLVGDALNAGRQLLTDQESMRLIEAAGIPVAESRYAPDVAGLRDQTAGLAPPYALKVLNEVVCRPFADLGADFAANIGTPATSARFVALDLGSARELEDTANTLADAARARHPDLPVQGFKLQRMRRGMNSLQLSMGITRDRVFGPLLFFGTGGNPASALADRQVGLPPLNTNLARLLIDATHAGRAMGAYSSDADRDRDALAGMLVRLSQLVVDVPAIEALEINPLIVNRDGILALDARIALGQRAEFAIIPYPAELEETVTLPRSGRRILLRPIRGEDAPAHAAFVQRLSPEAIRFRFFQPRSSFTHLELAQATQIDYSREMAFIASAESDKGKAETLGVVRAWTDPDNVSAEFAIIIDDAMRGEGLGRLLLEKMVEYARRRGTLELRGTVLPDNRPMLRLAKKLGFTRHFSEEDDAMVVTLHLNEPTDDWQRSRLQ